MLASRMDCHASHFVNYLVQLNTVANAARHVHVAGYKVGAAEANQMDAELKFLDETKAELVACASCRQLWENYQP